jgi:uncharacterized protein involved in outer membrane biogenesis
MKKSFIVAGLLLATAVGAGAFFLLSNLNSLVATAIEKSGSEVTETKVSVSGVDLSLRDGSGSISDLRIASPDGFTAQDVFSLADISIDLDVSSLREDPIVIEEIRIRAPVINAELLKSGASNIDELRKRIQAHSGDSVSDGGGDQKNLRIRKFVFEQGRIEVDATALGVDKRTIELPEIRLNDVGGKDGAPPEQIAKIILTTYASKTGSAIANSEINRLIEAQLGGSLADKAKGLFNKLR